MSFANDPNVVTGITAFAGGGAASATQLTGRTNVVATCATGGDSVKLPAGLGQGGQTVVRNNGAASCNVFPPTGGNISAAGVNTAVAVGISKASYFECVDSAGLIWIHMAGA